MPPMDLNSSSAILYAPELTIAHDTSNIDGLISLRFKIVVVVGASLALFGAVANALLFKLFLSRVNFRLSPFFFLGFVALFDSLLDAAYIILLTPPIMAEYFDHGRLYLYWLPRAKWLYLFGQMCKTSSCFCLIVASFERYMMTRHWTFSGFETKSRWTFLSVAVMLACLVRLLTANDLQIHFNPAQLRVFQRYTLYTSSPSMLSDQSDSVGGFWNLLHLLTVIIPFGTLVFLNGGIVLMLRHQNVQQLRSLITELTMGHDAMKLRKRNLKAATNTLLVIITAYLISNLLNLFLAVAHYLYPGYLQRHYPMHYLIGSDLASVLTVIGNALRFPAHFCSNKEIREHLASMLCSYRRGVEPTEISAVGGSKRGSGLTIRRLHSNCSNSTAVHGSACSLQRRVSSACPNNPWLAALFPTSRSITPEETKPHLAMNGGPKLLLVPEPNSPHSAFIRVHSTNSSKPFTPAKELNRGVPPPRPTSEKPVLPPTAGGYHRSSGIEPQLTTRLGGDLNFAVNHYYCDKRESSLEANERERGFDSNDAECKQRLLDDSDYAYVDETTRTARAARAEGGLAGFSARHYLL